jgi:pimeloyl-ACP methyl ester carboxylesterase
MESKKLRYVLLPGMDGTGELFAPFYEMMPHSTVADMVRYRPDVSQTYSEIIDKVYARLPRTEAFVLVAESFSGPIATMLTRRAEREGLPLVAVVYVASFVRSPIQGVKRMLLNNPLGRLIHGYGSPLLLQGLTSLNGCKDFAIRGRLEALLVRAYAQVLPETRRLRLLELLRVDCSKAFAQINTPLLYIHATNDRVLGKTSLVHMQKLNSHMKTVNIDAPHRVMQTNPIECWRAISGFVETL